MIYSVLLLVSVFAYKPKSVIFLQDDTSLGVLAGGIESLESDLSEFSANLEDALKSIDDQLDASIQINADVGTALIDNEITQLQTEYNDNENQISVLEQEIAFLTNECGEFTNCGVCTDNTFCVWCLSSKSCEVGDKNGGTNGNCAAFTYGDCNEDCNNYLACSDCLTDSLCGWCENGEYCLAGTANDTGSCSSTFYYFSENNDVSICPESAVDSSSSSTSDDNSTSGDDDSNTSNGAITNGNNTSEDNETAENLSYLEVDDDQSTSNGDDSQLTDLQNQLAKLTARNIEIQQLIDDLILEKQQIEDEAALSMNQSVVDVTFQTSLDGLEKEVNDMVLEENQAEEDFQQDLAEQSTTAMIDGNTEAIEASKDEIIDEVSSSSDSLSDQIVSVDNTIVDQLNDLNDTLNDISATLGIESSTDAPLEPADTIEDNSTPTPTPNNGITAGADIGNDNNTPVNETGEMTTNNNTDDDLTGSDSSGNDTSAANEITNGTTADNITPSDTTVNNTTPANSDSTTNNNTTTGSNLDDSTTADITSPDDISSNNTTSGNT